MIGKRKGVIRKLNNNGNTEIPTTIQLVNRRSKDYMGFVGEEII